MQKRLLLGLAWLSLVILVFVCSCRHEGPRIEADLQERTLSVLAKLDGLDASTQQLEAKVDGRDLRLSGSVQDETIRQGILGAVGNVRGLRRVDDRLRVGGLEPTSRSASEMASRGGAVAASEGDANRGQQAKPLHGVSMAAGEGGRWLLQGRVASLEQRQAWLDAAHQMFGKDLVVDQMEMAGDPAEAGNAKSASGQSDGAISPSAWVAALATGPSDGGLFPGDRSVRVEGSVPDEPAAQRFLTAVGGAVPEDWQIEDALKRIGAADPSAVQDALIATLQIRNIEFESNSSSMTPAGRQIVLRVAQALRAAPLLAVDIEGHTDSSGNADWNQTLSQERAEAVAEALQTLGIDAARLKARGFGSQRPMADNSTQEGRQANRRIEFKVLGGTRP